MSYPRNILTGTPGQQRFADLNRRLKHLERVSGFGKQRAGKTVDTRTELTATAYGVEPWWEVRVEVPEDSWVIFTGNARFYIAAATGTGIERRAYGQISELLDPTDPLYAGTQVYYSFTAGSGSGASTQNRYLHPSSDDGNVSYAVPWVYIPTAGPHTYRLDFRIVKDDPNDKIYLDRCEFNVEVW